MALRTYRIRYDFGSAPNPFWGALTLAICMPVIRREAKLGDWVAGFRAAVSATRESAAGTLVFAMRVDEVLPPRWYDQRFPQKRPDLGASDRRRWLGDNLYDFSDGAVIQREGVHAPTRQANDLRRWT